MKFESISIPVSKEYFNEKLEVLKDFCVKPTAEELDAMKECKTEVSLDNYCRELIENRINTMPKPKKKLKWYAEKKRS